MIRWCFVQGERQYALEEQKGTHAEHICVVFKNRSYKDRMIISEIAYDIYWDSSLWIVSNGILIHEFMSEANELTDGHISD
jgi:hypothetical protein